VSTPRSRLTARWLRALRLAAECGLGFMLGVYMPLPAATVAWGLLALVVLLTAVDVGRWSATP
jgi:hypothetical protein